MPRAKEDNLRQLADYWEIVANKLEREPALLEVVRQNIIRWQGQGHSAPQRLAEWEGLLAAAQRDAEGFQRLMQVLRGKDAQSVRLREFSPFAGILTREERRRARELCGYRH